jgi:hypothetical protein
VPVPVETFVAAVRRLAELRDQGQARLAIGHDGSIAIAIDSAAENPPAPGGGLFNEISAVLTAIAAGTTVDEFVRQRSEPGPNESAASGGRAQILVAGPFGGPDTADSARAKYEAASEAFPPEELKTRAWVHSKSKLPLLAGLEWEVLVREFEGDAHDTPAPRIPFAQLRITTRSTPPSVFPELSETVLTLDAVEVSEVLRELGQLHAALLRADTGTAA